MGRHHRRADPGRRRLRDELQVHARAGVALRLPARDGGDGGGLRVSLPALQALRLALIVVTVRVREARASDRGAIEAVTLAAYQEFAPQMPQHWELYRQNIVG